MSVIVDAAILLSGHEHDAIEAVNARLREEDTARRQQFQKLDVDKAGGSKWFTGEIWAAAFNHLIPHDIEEAVAVAPWRYPDEVVYWQDAYDYLIPPHAQTVSELRSRVAAEGEDLSIKAREEETERKP